MNVLLDECLPRKLKNALAGHDCRTVPEAGFAGKKNGQLLILAENAAWDNFLTMDKGIEYEQNLRDRGIAIVILRAKSNRLIDLLPLIPRCLDVLSSIHPGEVIRLDSRHSRATLECRRTTALNVAGGRFFRIGRQWIELPPDEPVSFRRTTLGEPDSSAIHRTL